MKKKVRRYHAVGRIAQELDLSEPMVHKLIHEGALKAVRFRRMVRVTDESYQKLLAELEKTPKTAA
jgi:excisionase family DNA binding protein